MKNKELSLEAKQTLSLEILQFVADFCKKHNIRYYLAYGTLLGAIRHNGFIPWDDDVDLFIPRPDYEKLLNIFEDTEDFKLITCFNSKDYVFPYAKVQSTKTKMRLPSGKIINQGLGIDLFPLDGIPDNLDIEDAEKLFIRENDVFINTVQKYDAFKFISPKTAKEHLKALYYRAIVFLGLLQRKGRLISVNPYNSDFDRCSRVSSVVGIYSGEFRVFKKEWFYPLDVAFENHRYIAPSGYDEILSMIYSNYLELPPEVERKTTHIASYIWL